MTLISTFSQISKHKKFSKLKASLLLSFLSFPWTNIQAMEADPDFAERGAPAAPNGVVQYVKAYSYQNPRQLENIAVVGASYLISPAHEPNKFLRYHNRRLEISDRQDVYSLFQFAPAQDLPEQIMANDDLFHLIAWNNQKIQIEDRGYQRDTINLKMNSPNSFIIRSQLDERDCRAPYLSYDNQRQLAIAGWFGNTNAPREFIWTFKPAFDLSQNLNAEEGFPLYKISPSEKISNLALTLSQIRALSQLHFQEQSNNLMFIRETHGYILAASKALANLKCLYVYSEDFNFEVTGLQGMKVKIKDGKKVQFHEDISSLDLERNKQLIIFIDWTKMTPYKFNLITFRPYKWEGWNLILFNNSRKGYKNTISFSELVINILNSARAINKGGYILQYNSRKNSIKFLDGNKNIITHPELAAYVANLAYEEVSRDMGTAFQPLGESFHHLAGSIETVAHSLDRASEQLQISSERFNHALITSNQHLSEQLQRRSNTLIHRRLNNPPEGFQ